MLYSPAVVFDEHEPSLRATVDYLVAHGLCHRDRRRALRGVRVFAGPGEAIEEGDSVVAELLRHDGEPRRQVAAQQGVLRRCVRVALPEHVRRHSHCLSSPPSPGVGPTTRRQAPVRPPWVFCRPTA